MRKYFFIFSALATCGLAVPALAADDGGPDYYEVTGVKDTHHLNIRTRGSMKATILGGAANGAKLKNMGCKDTGEGRWCQVETEAGLKGYAFGKFLKEGMAPAAAAAAPDSMPAKVPAFAIGKLKCERSNGSPVTECDYGVMRFKGGIAKVQVRWPDASKRTFALGSGVATSPEGQAVVKLAADGSYDITLTPTGAPTEHYVVAADVITGKK